MVNSVRSSYWVAYCDESDEHASDEDDATKGLGRWHGGSARILLGTLQLLDIYLGTCSRHTVAVVAIVAAAAAVVVVLVVVVVVIAVVDMVNIAFTYNLRQK